MSSQPSKDVSIVEKLKKLASAPAAKPPITCHILDTTLGRPAPSIPVTLHYHSSKPSSSPNKTSPSPPSPAPQKWTALTNSDGRVTSWTPAPTQPFSEAKKIEEVFYSHEDGGDQYWSLVFDTEGYFGGRGVETFFPEVQVGFCVRGNQRGWGEGKEVEHFHVPVLLGPFGYTTYRGS